MHKLRTIHLFAGAGGGILGDLLLGHQPVCAVEIDAYCQQVLSARQKDGCLPWFPIFADVKKFDGKPWRGKVDIVAGGFPCQDLSCAGKGAGLDGERSGLWSEMARIIGEVRPRYAFIENSPMLTIRGGVRVIADLAKMGYDARWGVLGGAAVGAPTDGERMWVAATSACIRLEDKRHTGSGKTLLRPTIWPDSFAVVSPEGWLLSTASRTVRGNDGLAHRVDRFKAVGNGQVPAVAALAWEILSEFLASRDKP